MIAMRTTIDAAGRLVIPKEIRRAAGLEAGTELDVRLRNGVVEVEPVLRPVKLVREGHFLVAVHEGEVGTFSSEDVQRVKDEIERERFGHFGI